MNDLTGQLAADWRQLAANGIVGMGLRALIVEGNVREARESYREGFGRTPSQSYVDTLGEIAPDLQCEICFPADAGANLPGADGLEAYDCVMVTGSSLNVYNGGGEVDRQIDLARAVFASRTPFFGSCWGLQIAAAATGGSVVRNRLGREIGFARNIAPTEAGRTHPLLSGRPGAFDAPCTHFDIVAIAPPGATTLATNAMSPIQAAEIVHDGGTFWGVQYHPEFSLREIATIVERRASDLRAEGFFSSEPEAGAYCADLRELDADPARTDIAWRYGLGAEIVESTKRRIELRNFIELFARPEKSRRGRA
jgi:GMP synthase (glutamine-hydrolysing)